MASSITLLSPIDVGTGVVGSGVKDGATVGSDVGSLLGAGAGNAVGAGWGSSVGDAAGIAVGLMAGSCIRRDRAGAGGW